MLGTGLLSEGAHGHGKSAALCRTPRVRTPARSVTSIEWNVLTLFRRSELLEDRSSLQNTQRTSARSAPALKVNARNWASFRQSELFLSANTPRTSARSVTSIEWNVLTGHLSDGARGESAAVCRTPCVRLLVSGRLAGESRSRGIVVLNDVPADVHDGDGVVAVARAGGRRGRGDWPPPRVLFQFNEHAGVPDLRGAGPFLPRRRRRRRRFPLIPVRPSSLMSLTSKESIILRVSLTFDVVVAVVTGRVVVKGDSEEAP